MPLLSGVDTRSADCTPPRQQGRESEEESPDHAGATGANAGSSPVQKVKYGNSSSSSRLNHLNGKSGNDEQGPFRLIALTQGKFAKIDPEMFDRINIGHWRCNRWGYATRTKRSIAMHRLVMNAPKGVEVDHKDGDRLNNRIANLRFANRQQNSNNTRRHKDSTSGAKGVSWFKRDQCWRAYIVVNYKQIHLGYFSDFEKAKAAYAVAAQKHHGEFCKIE